MGVPQQTESVLTGSLPLRRPSFSFFSLCFSSFSWAFRRSFSFFLMVERSLWLDTPSAWREMWKGFRRRLCMDPWEDPADSPLTCHCPDVAAAARPRPLLWILGCTGPYSCPSASDRPADWSTQKQAGSATDNLFLKRQAHHPTSADTQMI